jgi:hypothetical protein
MKIKICILALTVMACLRAGAGMYTETYTGPFNNNGGAGAGVIPNNSPVGLTDTETVSGLPYSISSVMLTVTLSGDYVSDLTGYLRLGNLPGSPSFDLTSALSAGNDTFTVDVSSAFTGLNPNGTWTLFLADTMPGGQNMLVSYSLEINAVPEPVTVALGIFGAFGLGVMAFRMRKAAG